MELFPYECKSYHIVWELEGYTPVIKHTACE